MPFLPAVCDGCSAIFSSAIYVRDYQVELAGFKANPCPKCGSSGYVRNGLHKFIYYTLTIIQTKDRSMMELTSLRDILVLARDGDLRAEHLEMIITYDLPVFTELLLLLPERKDEYHLCLNLIIQIVIALIKIGLEAHRDSAGYNPSVSLQIDVKVSEVIEQIFTNNSGTAKRLF